ncbi:DUF61 family protein [Methanobacterium sp. ACI-7]|uniref:DUF61 family protein n=1 Tax=unclassified Methanobacterium TaxID=2627676 RepID=UPI0039C2251E
MSRLDRSDNLVKKQILSLNRHIPRRRKNLAELLEEEKPHVLGSDGTRHRFKKDELKKIALLIDEKNYKNLKLPLYIEIDSTSSSSRINGRLESQLVCKILNIEPCKDELFIYKLDIKKLRSEFPTATQYIFLVR